MNASEIFIITMIVLLIFNVVYLTSTPDGLALTTMGAITGFIAIILAVGVIAGIQILGSGLNAMSIKILFGVGCLLNILFQVSISGFRIGLGLLNNVFTVFNSGDIIGLGTVISFLLGITVITSGLVTITGGSSA